ncbi:MAG: class I tRNA ligase family protein, partial [Clostridia bacterium]|nr:class I tRNA ligase family protein [Clostridia bacterium]
DALRFSLVMGISPGNDTRYSTEKVEMARNFANKVWNASRFVLMNMGDTAPELDRAMLTAEDKWILTRYTETVRQVTENFDAADYGLAAQKIYDFAWSEFCDWYIELSKSALLGDDEKKKDNARAVLLTVLSGLLRLLHPLMPFVTEEVFSYLPGQEKSSCMLSAWPEADESLEFPEACFRMEGVMDMVRAIRNLRSSMNVQAGHRARLMVRPAEGWAETLMSEESAFKRLAAVTEEILLGDSEKPGEKTVGAVTAAGEFFIPLGELVDLMAERKRLTKEKERLEGEIKRGEGKLNNAGFVSKAPAALVEAEKQKIETNRQMLAALEKQLRELEA